MAEVLTFDVRVGATTDWAGTILAKADVFPGGNGTFRCKAGIPEELCSELDDIARFSPGVYQLCETGRLPGWDNNLDGFVPKDDDGSTECIDLIVEAGTDHTIAVNLYPAPGGISHTSEYWATWSSCAEEPASRAVLDETLELTDVMPIEVGHMQVESCEAATRILQGPDPESIDRTPEPDEWLASEFLAARLNLLAGARSCDEAHDAVKRADRLLHSMHFTGDSPGTSAPGLLDKAEELSETLARFNRRVLCDQQPGPPIELPTIGVLIPLYWALRPTNRNAKNSTNTTNVKGGGLSRATRRGIPSTNGRET